MAQQSGSMIVVDGNLYFNSSMKRNIQSKYSLPSTSIDHNHSSTMITESASPISPRSSNITYTPSTALQVLSESNIHNKSPSSKKVTILRQGTMRKQNRVNKSWKKRWFVLRSDGHLLCYNNKESKHLLDTIDCKTLTNILCESWSPSEKRRNGIHIKTTRRSWKLLCRSNDVRFKWILKFEKVSDCAISL